MTKLGTDQKADKHKDNHKGTLYKRGKYFHLCYFLNGKRFRMALRDDAGERITTEREAKSARDKILAPYVAKDVEQRRKQAFSALQSASDAAKEAEEAAREKLSLADSWEKYKKTNKRPKSGESTMRQYFFQWDAFVKWLTNDPPKAKLLCEVTPEMADDYVGHLREALQLAPGTINKHIRLCKLVLRVLGPNEKMNQNPFADVEMESEVQNHRKELSLEKIGEICDSATGEMKALVFLGLYTGQRLGDCCLLTWDQVDLAGGTVAFIPRKTARRNQKTITIPIHPSLGPILAATPKSKRSGFVLPGLAELYHNSRDKVTDQFQALLKKCGVQIYEPGTGRKKKEGMRAVLRYGFHSLRHSAVSLLQHANVPLAVTQQIVGHRTVAVTEKYTHVGLPAVKSAIASLPPIGEKPKTDNELSQLQRELADLGSQSDLETLRQAVAVLRTKAKT